MNLRLALQTSLLLVLGLPVMLTTLWWIEQLLAALGDTAAVSCLETTAVVLRVIWLMTLVGLLIVLAFAALSRGEESTNDELAE